MRMVELFGWGALLTASAMAQTATQAAAPGQAQVPAAAGAAAKPATPAGAAGTQTGTTLGNGQINSPGAAATAAGGPVSAGPGPTNLAPGTFAQPGASLTLEQVLALARSNEPAFAGARANAAVAKLDRSIARTALLPSVVYHNQFLYTQANGAFAQSATTNPAASASATGFQSLPRFIANNAVHEYVSQGVVTETLGLVQYTALAKADAALAIANAELEISRRGLTSTVAGLFYGTLTAQRRVEIQQRAANEAADFVKQTRQREAEREVAHADVIKAQVTQLQRERDLADAQLMVDKTRLDLGVLLFADPRSPYTVTVPAPTPLPTRAAVEAAIGLGAPGTGRPGTRSPGTGSPELRSAVANLQASNIGVTAATAALLPDLVLNYSYGIDAAQFATTGPNGVHNLGYSASATLDVPIFDWFATEKRIKQARILRDTSKLSLSATQRQLIVQLDQYYAEAALATKQIESLQQSADLSRESLRLTRLRYSAGEATVLEVVDAQNTLTAAELALQDGTVRYQVALANLQLLTGTI